MSTVLQHVDLTVQYMTTALGCFGIEGECDFLVQHIFGTLILN